MQRLKSKIKVFLAVTSAIFASQIFAQTKGAELIESNIAISQNDLTYTTIKETDEIVVNIKMIERFYELYDEIEVLPFDVFLSQNNFEDAKLYLNVYRSLNLDTIDTKKLNEVIAAEKARIEEKIKHEEIFKAYMIAIDELNRVDNKQ